MLSKDTTWKWTPNCDYAFKQAKELLASSNVLIHYDLDLPITLAADASSYGIGAVISHTLPSGEERPIAFASRSLSKCEQNYSQVEKEALSLIFGIKKFYQYLFGRHFTLITDHKPLTTILGPKNAIPILTAARLQRWALFLTGFNYDIQYKSTSKHGNADGLSRLPLGVRPKEDDTLDIHILSACSDTLPITSKMIRTETRRDPILSQVMDYTLNGWPSQKLIELQPYFTRRHELTVIQGCLLWGYRVIVPPKFRSILLHELHEGHIGVVKMKGIARSYIWWPNLDSEIEICGKSCPNCQKIQSMPPLSPLHPWIYPDHKWQRIHLDFAGPFQGVNFLVAVDAYSKWPEVKIMKSTTASKTIEALREIFSRNGLPQQIVSDNGPQFISKEFRDFENNNGITHIFSAPYHAASNGLAERFVKTLKHSLSALSETFSSVSQRLTTFLLAYRNAPHATTQEAPAKLMHGSLLRTRLDLLKPDLRKKVQENQTSQSKTRESYKPRQFNIGQKVLVRNYREGEKWIPGIITNKEGSVSYEIKMKNGELLRRHIEQIVDYHLSDENIHHRPNHDSVYSTPTTMTKANVFIPHVQSGSQDVPAVQDSDNSDIPMESVIGDSDQSDSAFSVDTSVMPKTPTAPRRNPARIRKPPDRLDL